jgi:hypothetical protein
MKSRNLLLNGLMVVVFVTCLTHGTAHAQPGEFPNLSDWIGTWFKLTVTATAFHYPNVGVKPNPSYAQAATMGKAYLNITDWDGINHILTADIYTKDHDTDEWITTPFAAMNIEYFAGTALQFRGSARLADPNDVTMNLIFVFSGKQTLAGDFILGGITKVSTMASNILEIDDAEGSTERWIGSVKISGPMVSTIPFTPTPP